MTNSNDWVPAMEAAKQLAPTFGGISRAQQAIMTALREGLLRARAEVCAYTDEDAEFVEETATADCPIEIPAEVWHWSDNWAADVMRWRWDDGWFVIQAEDAEQDRTFIGVTFSEEQLRALDPSMPVFASVQDQNRNPKAKRGRKTKTNSWGALIGAVVDLERNNRLRVRDYESPAALIARVREKIPDTDLWLDERAMQGVLGYVWQHHLED